MPRDTTRLSVMKNANIRKDFRQTQAHGEKPNRLRASESSYDSKYDKGKRKISEIEVPLYRFKRHIPPEKPTTANAGGQDPVPNSGDWVPDFLFL